ncbi:transcription factor E4F1 isoform X1 [Centropristis striata]|uniref:transcription factor E4F1 isoform X1 n=1 Tax=Centropristis striata TaxID=184440 RepID=UPI0027DF4894|nr:transcription factor E4F1 isoform X1 [Centropristis striata]
MNVENNHTAETERETPTDGSETITIQTTLGDEDEDVHKCGRCQSEFSTLEAFIQHKLQQTCRRVEAQEVTATNGSSSSEVKSAEGASPDEPVKATNDESSGSLGRGRRKKTVSVKAADHSDGTDGSLSDIADGNKSVYKVNHEGRYICELCDKTFKTTNILRTHLKTHSDLKNFSCDLCGTSFRTKGSLIRHNRRHTDERPYRCTLCGQSFRESGALTRHLKALTPCTEKIRFVQYKEILVSKDGRQKGVEQDLSAVSVQQQEVMVVEQQPEEQELVEGQTAVVSVVEAGSQEVLHQLHFTMEVNGTTQEQQVVVEQSQAEALLCSPGSPPQVVVEQSQAEALLCSPGSPPQVVVEQSQAEALLCSPGSPPQVVVEQSQAEALLCSPGSPPQVVVEQSQAEALLCSPGSPPQVVVEQSQAEALLCSPGSPPQVVVEQSQAEALLCSPGSPPQVVVEQSQAEALLCSPGSPPQVVVEQSQAEALAAAAAAGNNLICQAIINSGIALGTEEEAVVEETTQTAEEEMEKEVSDCPDAEEGITEVQVKEEFVEMETEEAADGDGDDQTSSKLHTCPHCNRSFKGLNYFRFHVKGHLGYKPFKCTLCHKEFLTGYLLKKHMEVHVSERRYKCGECGKLYKTIGHVREHMRAHSDERPYRCTRCNKGYKTKNALQVHQRTHGDEKPYVCQFCLRGFREKGSLVRHIRHHTGEKPFKCPKCGRGFAEHGTLNRHMRAKGGCQKDDSTEQQDAVTEEQTSVDNLATAAIISEDPHAVLVEFSSVVADTQEYIIKTQTEEEVQEEEVTLIQDSQNEMGNHIMKVVQRIVSQSQAGGGSGSHQIIVRNVALNEDGPSISDCGDTITIATPESLTEQVAMTLASAISDGTLLATAGTVETADGTVTMVTTEETVEEGMEMVQQQEEYVITSPEEVEIQTVIV